MALMLVVHATKPTWMSAGFLLLPVEELPPQAARKRAMRIITDDVRITFDCIISTSRSTMTIYAITLKPTERKRPQRETPPSFDSQQLSAERQACQSWVVWAVRRRRSRLSRITARRMIVPVANAVQLIGMLKKARPAATISRRMAPS